MIAAIFILFMFSCILLFWAILKGIFLSDKKMQKRMEYYLSLNETRKLSRGKFNLLMQIQLYNHSLRKKMLTPKKQDKLLHLLERSGVSIKPEQYLALQWTAAALCGGLLYFTFGSFAPLALGAFAGFIIPGQWVRHKRRVRLKSFRDGLQDLITTIIGSLKAGFSFSQALKTVVEEFDSPIKEEMDRVLKEMQYGSSMEEALNHLKERMMNDDLDLMIQAILIQHQIGGNLAKVLESIVQTIRDRNKIENQIHTLTAQGRLSGIVIGLLPIVVGILLYCIQPSYIGSLFQQPIGLMMLAGGAVSSLIGFIFIRKITSIEV